MFIMEYALLNNEHKLSITEKISFMKLTVANAKQSTSVNLSGLYDRVQIKTEDLAEELR